MRRDSHSADNGVRDFALAKSGSHLAQHLHESAWCGAHLLLAFLVIPQAEMLISSLTSKKTQLSLLCPKRLRRINPRGSPRGQPAGERGGAYQHQRGAN